MVLSPPCYAMAKAMTSPRLDVAALQPTGHKHCQVSQLPTLHGLRCSSQVAAFIAETIQGVGGATPLAPGYLPAVYKSIREAGGVCIADEVQTGFGRTVR